MSIALTLWLAAAPELTWSADAACPSGDTVLAMTAGLLADGADATHVRAQALVERGAEGFVLTLQVDDGAAPPQTRTLVDPQCEALAKATALLLAMAVDPLPVAERVVPNAVLVPEPDPVAAVQAPPPTAPASSTAAPTRIDVRPRSPKRPRVLGSVGVFAGAGIGVQPRVTGVFGARAGLSRRRLRAEIAWRHTLPTTAVYDDRPGLGARVYGWAASARLCFAPSIGPVELPLCAGGAVGRTRANGQGTDADRVVRGLRAAALASAGLRWRFARRFVLTGTVDAELPVVRAAYHIQEFRDPTRDVHVEPAVGVIPSVGLEVEFP